MTIPVQKEERRGCGWRKVGGIYLCGSLSSVNCGRLPIPLTTCPCCGRGIKPARGWTWVDPNELIRAADTNVCTTSHLCSGCPIARGIDNALEGMAGLIWVGEKYYPTPKSFIKESNEVGISRRLNSVPHAFVLGKTWILLAHRRAIQEPLAMGKEPKWIPGIFQIFKPTGLEIICDGTETEETIAQYEQRGLTPVRIKRGSESMNNDGQKNLPLVSSE